MAGSRIKRITVEIGSDTTGWDKALKSVNSVMAFDASALCPFGNAKLSV